MKLVAAAEMTAFAPGAGPPADWLPGERFSICSALFRFFVEPLCFGSRPAKRGQSAHNHDPLVRTPSDPQFIADANAVPGFDPTAVEMNLASFNRIGCKTPCLKEARRPQPFVDSSLLFGLHGFDLNPPGKLYGTDRNAAFKIPQESVGEP